MDVGNGKAMLEHRDPSVQSSVASVFYNRLKGQSSVLVIKPSFFIHLNVIRHSHSAHVATA